MAFIVSINFGVLHMMILEGRRSKNAHQVYPQKHSAPRSIFRSKSTHEVTFWEQKYHGPLVDRQLGWNADVSLTGTDTLTWMLTWNKKFKKLGKNSKKLGKIKKISKN